MSNNTQHVFSEYKPRRASHDIAGEIREVIFSKELKEGDRLPTEGALAEQFNVSRITIREALRLLESKGLIEIRKGAKGGAFVHAASVGEVASIIMDKLDLDGITTTRHVIDTRIALERGIVKSAIEKSVPEDLERIEESLEEYKGMISAVPGKSGREIIQKMFEFHSLLARASHNPPMIIFHRTIIEWADRRLMSWDPPKKWQMDQYKSHKEIFGIIKKKDIALAQKMIEKHFENVMLWHR